MDAYLMSGDTFQLTADRGTVLRFKAQGAEDWSEVNTSSSRWLLSQIDLPEAYRFDALKAGLRTELQRSRPRKSVLKELLGGVT